MKKSIEVMNTLPDAMRKQGWVKLGTTSDRSMLLEIRRDYEAQNIGVVFTRGAIDDVHYWMKTMPKQAPEFDPAQRTRILDANGGVFPDAEFEAGRPAPQHTPGPWRYDGDYIVAPDPAGKHPDIYLATIATEDEEGRMATTEQQYANGVLIQAAPALLAVAKQLSLMMADMADRDELSESENELFIALREAVAQATNTTARQ